MRKMPENNKKINKEKILYWINEEIKLWEKSIDRSKSSHISSCNLIKEKIIEGYFDE